MEITKILYITTRDEWRGWLETHHQSEPEIWLVYYRAGSGKARIPYNEAVEEALCFGWIDSLNKGLDDERLVQRFSPRKPGSAFSQTNKERLKRLIAQGKVTPEVLESLAEVDLESFTYPADILAAIRANEKAWENFQKYSESYRRIRVAYIDDGRRRSGQFEKRLAYFLRKTETGKQFGFGIEDYY